ncbi:host attachment protein [Amorphus sp. 3PC139-8]|uniref:baeRF12 domain-containing protein n=1 Tax=Amorphus sp. 3PC139-8 TaxID=2735676 RepID=UPI00345DC28C
MKIPHDAKIVVADGERALFLRNAGDDELVDLKVVEHEEIDNPPTREQGTDKPGRFNDAGPGRSAVADTDWHELEKERFAHHLAERLHKLVHNHPHTKLILVAAPKVMGDVRPALHKEVAECVIGEISKDLTNHPVAEMEKILKES